ncbi:AAA family ATPase [Paraburkholderia sediminicola]|uniref:TrlF family AAA-like ATPase n=1 Tax=Paraburkholderia sediminicola TaxID=458836 RepID=UPI0038B99FEF
MGVKYSRGAEWRIWDLQVHTPYSALNNGFGSDLEAYAKIFFTKAIEKNIAVIGVTDYFLVDGYKYLRALQQDVDRLASLIGKDKVQAAQEIKLFANVELRTNILVNGNRVNYHVIFSDEVSPDDIRDNFLARLSFTSEGNPAGIDQEASLTRANLEHLGRTLKAQHENFQKHSDIFVGLMQATIDTKTISTELQKQESLFANRYVFCVPCDEDLSSVSWNGQGHMLRKVLIQKSHILFSSNANTRAFALGQRHNSPEEYLAEFRTFKPCLHSSDSHAVDELFEPDDARYTWIKADPTFRGLLQTINEPDGRVYVGASPPSLESVRSRTTKIVRELTIRKTSDSNLAEAWFDHQLPLNPELVAIIGNKGSGKSALADILGLIGNTPRHGEFSFLHPERFRDRKSNKAKHFEAFASWGDGTSTEPIRLDETPPEGVLETIKYIPQDYLETICNEVSLGSDGQFYAELQNVIFSHVSPAEQLGHASLDELLRSRSQETQKAIDFLVDQIKSMNRAIVAHEDRLSLEHRRALDAQLEAKKRELQAHDLAKPDVVVAPDVDPALAEKSKQTADELQKLQGQLDAINGEVTSINLKITDETKRRTTAERLLGKLGNLKRQYEAAVQDAQLDATELSVSLPILVDMDQTITQVETIRSQAEENGKQLNLKLSPETAGGLFQQKEAVGNSAAKITADLSAPQKAYEEYKAALKRWEEARDAIVGTVELLGSVTQIQIAIAQLPAVALQVKELRRVRMQKAGEIYREKQKLRDDYARYYGAVQKFLAEHPLARGGQIKLTFNVAIAEERFAPKFLKFVSQRRVGTFSGIEEGAELLKLMLASTDFDLPRATMKFVLRLMRALREDRRPGRNNARLELKAQLAQSVTPEELYDFVFSLSYLEPVYSLRWDGKTLEQLSPGERGNLLLIFYLLIDRDDIPLVIDQPEENLDNHTVYRTLVPCVKEAKRRRQVIMVTHNPNLAVVCDAEQIIYAEIRKDRGNEVTYLSGSIEEPEINRKIVDVLEGTRPAFNKRDAKYFS